MSIPSGLHLEFAVILVTVDGECLAEVCDTRAEAEITMRLIHADASSGAAARAKASREGKPCFDNGVRGARVVERVWRPLAPHRDYCGGAEHCPYCDALAGPRKASRAPAP